jgi:ribosome-associated protein
MPEKPNLSSIFNLRKDAPLLLQKPSPLAGYRGPQFFPGLAHLGFRAGHYSLLMRKAPVSKTLLPYSSEALSRLVVQGMIEKKAQDVVLLDLRHIRNAMADFFVICSGTSDTQLDAICDSVEEAVAKGQGEHPWSREGKMGKEWILMDYGDCIVHIFKKSRRQFYTLEQLWGDAECTYFDEFGRESATPIPAVA